MNHIILLILIALITCSCRSNPGPKPTVVRVSSAPTGTKSMPEPRVPVRYPESVSVYAVSRYVDPSNSRVLHESHDVYRVEQDPTWNLNTPPGVHSGPPVALIDPAYHPAPTNGDEVAARLNAQEQKTAQIEQAIGAQIQSITGSSELNRQLIIQNQVVVDRVEDLLRRQRFLEEEIKKRPIQTQPPTQNPAIKDASNW